MNPTVLDKYLNSRVKLGKLYYWTATINQSQPLLAHDEYKDIVVRSLQFLAAAGKIEIFAFVIVPDQVQIIWKMIEMNGKEMPHASFLKFTAHLFQRKLREESENDLESFRVSRKNKRYEFWERNSTAELLLDGMAAFMRLQILHLIPLDDPRCLVEDPCDYYYSSASYYGRGENRFYFLKDLRAWL